MSLTEAFSGRRVLVTGHTGFKGAWICEWLLALGAEVHGFSLEPDTEPSLFDQLDLANRIHGHRIGDVRNAKVIHQTMVEVRPDFVFHLAAQPLVRYSYKNPVETFETNVTGTLNVLEALRVAARPTTCVVITTDKVYENDGAGTAFEESDSLGGHDPYSASKGAAEIVVHSYRRSFFQDGPVRVGTARAGNVIGGGDWARDRIVPDIIRALQAGEPIPVRNPSATRPWQHVLEPLGGYLALAQALEKAGSSEERERLSRFNFGPAPGGERPVRDLLEEMLKHCPGTWEDLSDATAVHEATRLDLSIARAQRELGWQPKWNFEQTVRETMLWYNPSQIGGKSPSKQCLEQIIRYQDLPLS